MIDDETPMVDVGLCGLTRQGQRAMIRGIIPISDADPAFPFSVDISRLVNLEP